MGNGGDGTGSSPIITEGNKGTHSLIVGFREAQGASSSKSGNDNSTQVISWLAVSGVESRKTNVPVVTGGKNKNNSVKISKPAAHQTDSDKRQGGKKDIVVMSTNIVVPVPVTLDPSNNMTIQIVDENDMGTKKVNSNKEGYGAEGEIGLGGPTVDRRLSIVKGIPGNLHIQIDLTEDGGGGVRWRSNSSYGGDDPSQ
ncbi:hypothetical protein V6N13_026059 [Hibiscus sabdariffa]